MDTSISNNIKYIGVDDLELDLFESQYIIPEGMAYNSYLIDDDKVTINLSRTPSLKKVVLSGKLR